MTVRVKSSLAAGIAAGLVAVGTGVAVVSPVAATPPPVMASPAVQLSALAATLPLPAAAKPPTKPTTNPFGGGNPSDSPGQRIINSYNALQPWVQYGVDLSAWGGRVSAVAGQPCCTPDDHRLQRRVGAEPGRGI